MDTSVILLATYNGEKYLSKLIESLINQTVKSDIFISDDCSTDDTLNIIKYYTDRCPQIKLINVNKKNIGVNNNFNILLGSVNHKYIFFADQDDIWLKNKVEDMINIMKSAETDNNSRPLLIHSDLTLIDRNDVITHNSFWKYQNMKIDYRLNRLLLENCVTGCTSLINKELADRVYPIPDNAVMYDWWISLIATLEGNIISTKEKTVLYRQHGGNLVGAQHSILNSVNKMLSAYSISKKSFIQCKELLKRSSKNISKENKHILETYLDILDRFTLSRLYLIFNNKFYKSTLLKTIINTINLLIMPNKQV